MNHPHGMSRPKAIEQLCPDRLPLFERQRSLFQAFGQGLAFQEFHAEVGPAAMLSKVVNTADVGMADAPGNLHLPLKALQESSVHGKVAGDDFDRHTLAQLPIQGLEDLTHAPSTDEPDDFEALCNQISGLNRPGCEYPGNGPQKRRIGVGMFNQSPEFLEKSGILDRLFEALHCSLPFGERFLRDLFKQSLQSLPVLRRHADNSACNHARAMAQSRLTVRELTFRYSAISSSDIPPK